ncbi:hypothetical protein BKI51_17520 [Alphaproteobacteria bacterium AO1-B]|nr:hypothetical protein BKI51_17520 [Alphaproteobacteria bacterium AO1-B]
MTPETGQYETFHFFECIQKLTLFFIFEVFSRRAEVSDKTNLNEFSKKLRWLLENHDNERCRG